VIDSFLYFLLKYDERRIHNLLTLMLYFKFKSLRLFFSFIGHEHEVAIIKEYDRKSLFPMFSKFHHHLHPLFELKIALFIESMMIGIWTFLRWMWLTPINLQMFVHEKLLNFINIHYYKSWLFKRFNLTKVSTLTKMIFVLTKAWGMKDTWFLLVGYFD
jgi:hypothetical protein